ncbi:MsnO8 family LLM class oxidoreductase [Pseudooceanicola sp. GBMRC 2024]|uniref:MsnO8 family LLM class oxidoreductase n=1 Tax=Pseudooceanicola albus TaxID=2692189 RepID=A0A6L7G2L8_9RHOB|nr:MsnO8 family LLM class oxidoreductase [Pseudooceanicola albus]MXN17758.1 MsnO8 family LLM class oxidoreductase [Pseudooceanicola albus]
MHDPLTLSVLDIGPIRTNQSAADCLASMVALARQAEDLGYHRYWLAEHHNVAAVAASHTPVLAGVIGSATRRIRVGGCVLLAHYPPFLVAEQMGLLEAACPGRVDLGIGRSTGADWASSALLRGGTAMKSPEGFAEDLSALLAMNRPEGLHFARPEGDLAFRAVPGADSAPVPWILGTSEHSARTAAELGLPYAFGYHIRAEGAREAIDLYRRTFRPSPALAEPRVLVSAIVVMGESDAEARRLARAQLYFMCAFRSGERVAPQMLAEEADAIPFPDRYAPLVEMFERSWIIGGPERAAAALGDLARDLGVQEMMINPVAAAYGHQPADRAPNRAYTLSRLAEAFPQRAPVPA